MIYVDINKSSFPISSLRFLIGKQLIKQHQLRSKLANDILMDFLNLRFDYKGSDLELSASPTESYLSSALSHKHCFTLLPPIYTFRLVINIPLQFLWSSCATFLVTSYLQINWHFPTTNMSKCPEYFQKSYLTPATFNFRYGNCPLEMTPDILLSENKKTKFNPLHSPIKVNLKLLVPLMGTICPVSHMKLDC